ncbi:MFS transporter [bacterium]|nr:MFS transporter [bacterium]
MYREVLKNRNFLKLWGAQVASQVAAQLLNYGLIIHIYELAKGTRFASSSVSLFIVAIGIPAVLFAVPAGAYADLRDRKRILNWANALRALLVPFFILFDGQLAAVYALALVVSIFSQFFVPAEGAALPRLVKEEHLPIANSFFVFTLNASFIIGYSLAAPIISRYGVHAVYAGVTVAFVIALLLTMTLPQMKPPKMVKFEFVATYRAIIKDLRLHFTKIIREETLLFPILLISIAQTIVGIIAALAPAMSQQLFDKGLAETSHFLVLPAGVGLIIGSVIAGKLLQSQSKVRVIFIALFLAAGLLGAMVLLPLLAEVLPVGPVTAVLTFGMGLLNAGILVAAQTLLQLASTDSLRGQIFGTLNMMINIAALLPVFVAGLLADFFSPLSVVGAIGGMLFLMGLIFLKVFGKISPKYA